MATKKKAAAKKKRSAKAAPKADPSKSKVVGTLLRKVEQKLSKDVKASLGDYIRLLQLHKELEEDEPRDITVTWIEPNGK